MRLIRRLKGFYVNETRYEISTKVCIDVKATRMLHLWRFVLSHYCEKWSSLSVVSVMTRRNFLKLITRFTCSSCLLVMDELELNGLINLFSVGHCHPKVVQAGAAQMATISTNNRFLHDELVKCAQNLVDRMPGDSLSVCYFVNSGSEANDLAMRLARAHTHQKDTITLDQ